MYLIAPFIDPILLIQSDEMMLCAGSGPLFTREHREVVLHIIDTLLKFHRLTNKNDFSHTAHNASPPKQLITTTLHQPFFSSNIYFTPPYTSSHVSLLSQYPTRSWKHAFEKKPLRWSTNLYKQDGMPFDGTELDMIEQYSQSVRVGG